METGVNLLLKDDIAALSSNPFGADLDKLEGACGIAVVEDCSKDVGAALPAFLLPSLPFSLSFVFDSSPPPRLFLSRPHSAAEPEGEWGGHNERTEGEVE